MTDHELEPEEVERIWQRVEDFIVSGQGLSGQAMPPQRTGPDRGRFVARAALLLIVIGLGVALVVWVRDPAPTEVVRPMTVGDIAGWAAEKPAYQGELPSYLRMVEVSGGPAVAHESWVDSDGYGCYRGGRLEHESEAFYCRSVGGAFGGLEQDQMDVVALASDPVGSLEAALASYAPRSPVEERVRSIVQILARVGVDPIVRSAAFNLLERYGFQVSYGTSGQVVLEGPGQIGQVYVESDSTLVVEARGVDPPVVLTFKSDYRAMPDR